MRQSQYPPVQDAEHIRPGIWERRSTGYMPMGSVWIPTPAVYFGEFPAGGFVATPGDFVRFFLAFLNGGEYQGARILKPETVELALTPQAEGMGGMQMGLAWMLDKVGEPAYNIQHGGAHMFGWHNWGIAWPNFDNRRRIRNQQLGRPGSGSGHHDDPQLHRELAALRFNRARGRRARLRRRPGRKKSPTCAARCSPPPSTTRSPSPPRYPTTRFSGRPTAPCPTRTWPSPGTTGTARAFIQGARDLRGHGTGTAAVSSFLDDNPAISRDDFRQAYLELGGNPDASAFFAAFFAQPE